MDDKHLFESVCAVLSHRGFEPTPSQAAGLFARQRPGGGLVLGWSPGQDLIGPTLHACPHPADAAGRTEFRGIRGALMLALAEVLGSAGFTVTTLGADLLVTAGPRDPGDAPALTAAAICPAPRRSRSACQVAVA
ncbi:hypothetical protein [Kitasatospora sp. GP82]|uniref:hypothetical protein n=1 Tax=Kitasatospora sp. GP82 TaxID=3035089 RepID=UPI0024768F8E|nr:hypothetical protein [Kitasatospora sp. GP82]MDH6129049.1 hypothetical protein [Kitasatospora sp. GP82]